MYMVFLTRTFLKYKEIFHWNSMSSKSLQAIIGQLPSGTDVVVAVVSNLYSHDSQWPIRDVVVVV